jgi:hypothetical protein
MDVSRRTFVHACAMAPGALAGGVVALVGHTVVGLGG